MVTAIDLNQREQRVLLYIVEHAGQHGYAPTMREIGEDLYMRGLSLAPVSTSQVVRCVDKLEAHGLIRRKKNAPRTIGLTDEGVRYARHIARAK